MPTSVLTTIIAVTSTRSVAILWDRTHAHVKQDKQEMGGLAMVRLIVLKKGVIVQPLVSPGSSYFKHTLE